MGNMIKGLIWKFVSLPRLTQVKILVGLKACSVLSLFVVNHCTEAKVKYKLLYKLGVLSYLKDWGVLEHFGDD